MSEADSGRFRSTAPVFVPMAVLTSAASDRKQQRALDTAHGDVGLPWSGAAPGQHTRAAAGTNPQTNPTSVLTAGTYIGGQPGGAHVAYLPSYEPLHGVAQRIPGQFALATISSTNFLAVDETLPPAHFQHGKFDTVSPMVLQPQTSEQDNALQLWNMVAMQQFLAAQGIANTRYTPLNNVNTFFAPTPPHPASDVTAWAASPYAAAQPELLSLPGIPPSYVAMQQRGLQSAPDMSLSNADTLTRAAPTWSHVGAESDQYNLVAPPDVPPGAKLEHEPSCTCPVCMSVQRQLIPVPVMPSSSMPAGMTLASSPSRTVHPPSLSPAAPHVSHDSGVGSSPAITAHVQSTRGEGAAVSTLAQPDTVPPTAAFASTMPLSSRGSFAEPIAAFAVGVHAQRDKTIVSALPPASMSPDGSIVDASHACHPMARDAAIATGSAAVADRAAPLETFVASSRSEVGNEFHTRDSFTGKLREWWPHTVRPSELRPRLVNISWREATGSTSVAVKQLRSATGVLVPSAVGLPRFEPGKSHNVRDLSPGASLWIFSRDADLNAMLELWRVASTSVASGEVLVHAAGAAPPHPNVARGVRTSASAAVLTIPDGASAAVRTNSTIAVPTLPGGASAAVANASLAVPTLSGNDGPVEARSLPTQQQRQHVPVSAGPIRSAPVLRTQADSSTSKRHATKGRTVPSGADVATATSAQQADVALPGRRDGIMSRRLADAALVSARSEVPENSKLQHAGLSWVCPACTFENLPNQEPWPPEALISAKLHGKSIIRHANGDAFILVARDVCDMCASPQQSVASVAVSVASSTLAAACAGGVTDGDKAPSYSQKAREAHAAVPGKTNESRQGAVQAMAVDLQFGTASGDDVVYAVAPGPAATARQTTAGSATSTHINSETTARSDAGFVFASAYGVRGRRRANSDVSTVSSDGGGDTNNGGSRTDVEAHIGVHAGVSSSHDSVTTPPSSYVKRRMAPTVERWSQLATEQDIAVRDMFSPSASAPPPVELPLGHWACGACTVINEMPYALVCSVCGTEREHFTDVNTGDVTGVGEHGGSGTATNALEADVLIHACSSDAALAAQLSAQDNYMSVADGRRVVGDNSAASPPTKAATMQQGHDGEHFGAELTIAQRRTVDAELQAFTPRVPSRAARHSGFSVLNEVSDDHSDD